jgi:perosamine synthetase
MLDIKKLLVNKSDDLRTAVEVIDKNAQGICFVVEDNNNLVGVVTDGDIRRALLKGDGLSSSVSCAIKEQFVSLHVDTPEKEIRAAVNRKITHVPLVDDQGCIVNYYSHFHNHTIPILEPTLGAKELEYVTECITTNWISSQGKFVTEFEEKFSKLHPSMDAVAVSNGTVALHLALVALGIGPGDEVIVPDLTFAASVNSIVYTGAEPVLVDIDRETWTMDVQAFEDAISPRTKAVMPVHLYGHACDMDPILAIAEKHGLLVIEDAAEALGSLYKGKPVGSFGHASTFSFFGNKTITTGEGGMVLFRDESTSLKAKVLRDHGMSKDKRYWHEFIGFNYRLTNMQAAIGVAQLERLNVFVESKRKSATTYNNHLVNNPSLTLPTEKEWAFHSYWLYSILLDSNIDRDDVMKKLKINGIDTRPLFYPMHEMPPYVSFRRGSNLEISKEVARRGLSLPSSANLSLQEIHQVVDALQTIVNAHSIAE